MNRRELELHSSTKTPYSTLLVEDEGIGSGKSRIYRGTLHDSLTSVIKYAVNLLGLNTKYKCKTKSSTVSEETCHLELGFWVSL